jgi:hypothetical protein
LFWKISTDRWGLQFPIPNPFNFLASCKSKPFCGQASQDALSSDCSLFSISLEYLRLDQEAISQNGTLP